MGENLAQRREGSGGCWKRCRQEVKCSPAVDMGMGCVGCIVDSAKGTQKVVGVRVVIVTVADNAASLPVIVHCLCR